MSSSTSKVSSRAMCLIPIVISTASPYLCLGVETEFSTDTLDGTRSRRNNRGYASACFPAVFCCPRAPGWVCHLLRGPQRASPFRACGGTGVGIFDHPHALHGSRGSDTACPPGAPCRGTRPESQP